MYDGSMLNPRAFVLAGILSVTAVQAQSPVLPPDVRAAADSISSEQIGKDLAFLASDELAGRNTPSPGFDKAAAYIVERLRQAGLKPAGDGGSYLQRYEMHESRLERGSTWLEVDGRRFAFGDHVVMRSLAGEVRGPRTAVYVGHGWSIPARGIDPYAGLDLTGKLVIAHGPRATPKDVEVRQIGRITPGASGVLAEAARRGAAAVVFIPQASALENWTELRTQNLARKELIPSVPSAYAGAPLTSVLVSREAAEAFFATDERGAGILEKGDRQEYPAPFELSRPVTLHVDTSTHGAHAVQRGGDARRGRSDAEGASTSPSNHTSTARSGRARSTGTPSTTPPTTTPRGAPPISRSLSGWSKVRPKRSLIFIWDSGEEQGLWGTRHFVANPPVPLDRIVAHVNIDMIGATRRAGSPDARRGAGHRPERSAGHRTARARAPARRRCSIA